MRYAASLAVLALLSSCGGSNAPAASLGEISGSRVSVLFQDFPQGTVCTASSPSGSVTQSTMPGKIEFPLGLADVDMACQTTDGSRYQITAHEGYDDATGTIGITVYLDGRSFATYGTAGGLVQSKKTNAVTQID